jgi:hypothetical protein
MRNSVSAVGFGVGGGLMRTAQNLVWVPLSRSCGEANGGGARGRAGE